MTLLEQWRYMAYSPEVNQGEQKRLWDDYFKKEKGIYKDLLSSPDTEVKGTVRELAEKYGIGIMTMIGFLDGIEESLKVPNDIEHIDEDSTVSLAFDKVKLYKNMVEVKADWLYGLPEWEAIFTEEEREQYYKEQKRANTFVRESPKVGRNDPCPCGSGKKYKFCCGRA